MKNLLTSIHIVLFMLWLMTSAVMVDTKKVDVPLLFITITAFTSQMILFIVKKFSSEEI